MQRTRWVWGVASLVLLLGTGGMGIWLLIFEPWKPQVRLSNGSRLIVDAVTFDTKTGPPPLPLIERLRFWPDPMLRRSYRLAARPGREKGPRLHLYIRVTGRPERAFSNPGVRVIGDDGASYYNSDDSYISHGAWRIEVGTSFPRRNPALTLRVRDGSQRHRELRVRNPAYRKDFPRWEAPSYPVEVRAGELILRVPRPPQLLSSGDPFAKLSSLRLLDLEFLERGRRSRGWGCLAHQVQDATGNRREGPVGDFPGPGAVIINMDTHEPAWKIIMHAGRQNSHPAGPDRTLTTDWLPIPPRNEVRMLHLRFGDPHFRLRLGGLCAPGTVLWPGIAAARTFGFGRLQTELTLTKPAHGFVRLLRVEDERGRDLLTLRGGRQFPEHVRVRWSDHVLRGPWQQTQMLPDLRGARRVRLTLGVSWSRRFEFLIRPGGSAGAIEQNSTAASRPGAEKP